jgi:hypothetical protein
MCLVLAIYGRALVHFQVVKEGAVPKRQWHLPLSGWDAGRDAWPVIILLQTTQDSSYIIGTCTA